MEIETYMLQKPLGRAQLDYENLQTGVCESIYLSKSHTDLITVTSMVVTDRVPYCDSMNQISYNKIRKLQSLPKSQSGNQ